MDIFEQVKRVGWHGLIGLMGVGAVVFFAVYGFVYRPDHELTARAFTVLEVSAGGIFAAAVFMLKGARE